jgi:hypothetical protein
VSNQERALALVSFAGPGGGHRVIQEKGVGADVDRAVAVDESGPEVDRQVLAIRLLLGLWLDDGVNPGMCAMKASFVLGCRYSGVLE